MSDEQVRFCNLHQHTTESHLDAICNIDDLFDRAKELGQRAIAVTDHGSMGGIYKAYKAYKRTGVKLIPGNEIYFTPDLEAPAKDPVTKEKNPLAKRYHLVLLAMNEKGYQNLLRVTYEGFKNSVTVMNKEFPRVDEAILRKYNEGLFALSACGGNIIAQSIFRKDHAQAIRYAEMLKSVYGERFFIELQPHGIKRGEFSQIQLNTKMREVADELGVKMVATCDAHYIKQSDEEYHDMVLAISDKKPLSDLSRHTYTIDVLCDQCSWGWVDKENKIKCTNEQCVKGVVSKKPCPEFYLKSEQEVLQFFTDHFDANLAEELITNVSNIADQCEPPDYIKPSGKEHIPTFDIHHISQCPDYEEFKKWRANTVNVPDDVAYLRFSVWKGFMQYMKKKGFSDEIKAKYWKRAKFEISVLESRNFSSYMLIVADYIRWARDNGVLVGPGRGSVGGCLVAFLIGIHRVDPIKYGLFFERFHNLQKNSLPDIDTDFAPSGREKVFNYCKRKYGEENVAYISNLNRFTPKVVLTDVIRSLEEGGDKSTAFRIAKAITSEIPDKVHEGDKIIQVDTMDKAVKHARGTVFKSLLEKNPRILDFAKAIVGLPRNYSTHAGGVVISDIPLPDFVPVRRDKKGAFAIQYEKNQAEENGLVKMDHLGLTTLDVISEVLEQAKAIGIELPDLDTLCVEETDHQEAYKVLESGLTGGCFQIEGHTLQPLCKPMKAKSIEDIALINALGRPSCSKKERKQFIARRNGEERIVYPHRLLENILKDTYGISIYEEDLLHLAPEIAGWDLSEADGLRKVTKLKEKGAALADQLEKKFINDCMERKNLTKEEGKFIWDEVIIPYSRYGFNKSVGKSTKIIVNDQEKEIQYVCPGDEVNTVDFDGNVVKSTVVALHDHGQVPMWEVEFDDGTIEQCTLDHKWLTRYGQQPMWRILEEELEIFGHQGNAQNRSFDVQGMRPKVQTVPSQKEASQSMQRVSGFTKVEGERVCADTKNSLWNRTKDDNEKIISSSKRMFEVQGIVEANEKEHYEQNKQIRLNEEKGFRNSEKDFCSSRNTIGESRAIEKMAGRKSGKICRDSSKSSRITEAFQDESLVRTISEILGLREKQANEMLRSSEASGLCSQREKCGDRSGWTVAFPTASWRREAEENTGERPTVGTRNIAQKLEIDPIKYGQLQILWRTYKDLIRQPFKYDKVQPTGNLQGRKVVRIEYLGFQQAYDLEVDNPSHNFLLSSGLCSSNSHAIAYSMLGYATAYYKIKARAPFFASVLNARLRSKSKAQDHDEYMSKIKEEARKYKVTIAACDINRSKQYYVATDNNHIVTGLGAVKGLGASALNMIISNQPYTSIEDFIVKNPSKVNKNHVQALAKAGAFDSFRISRKYVFDHFVPFRDAWKKYLKKADDSLFIGGDRSKPMLDQLLDGFNYSGVAEANQEWTTQERLEYEKEVLGEYVSGSPRELYPKFFKGGVYDTDFKLISHKNKGDTLLFEGLVTATREFKIKRGGNKGRRMGQITVENLKGESANITVWCETWEKYEKLLTKGDVPVQGEAYVNEDRTTKEKSWALSKIRVHNKKRKA